MNEHVKKALKIEADFLSRAESNFSRARGTILRGAEWRTARLDEGDRLRTMMVDRGMYDRAQLRSLPKNSRLVHHGYERRWFLWKKLASVAVATVLSPLESYLSGDGGEPRPVGLVELVDHVKRVVGDNRAPHVIGVCSPTGFTAEAKAARLELPNASVVLVEPRDDGGWSTTPLGEAEDPRIVRLFDLEGTSQKITRVREYVEEHSAELLTGGLSAEDVAAAVGMPRPIVERALQVIASEDPELRTSSRAGQTLLYRGAPVGTQEKSQMSMIDRIRQLFGSEGDESKKINLLSERRATLAQRRDRIYNDIGKLEKRESELLEQGKKAESAIVKRRLAAQLAQLRKDIARQNTTAGMLNQQINIISTHVHNLTLIQQGQLAQLPDTEELTQDAVKAEEMLESLRADADLVGSLETGIADTVTSEEELAILQEFEAAAPKKEAVDTPVAPREKVSEEWADEFAAEPPPLPDAQKKKRSEPEAT
jgi:hypothetical protein